MHRRDKFSQHSSIIWSVWLNVWVFVYELCSCGFESHCSHLNYKFRACFEQGYLWQSCKYRVWISRDTYGCCYGLTSLNVYTSKKMWSRWYRSQFNKIEKAWVRVEILCLDFRKTRSNQYIKSRKVATFKNYEIFSNLYFSYVRNYKATLSGGN